MQVIDDGFTASDSNVEAEDLDTGAAPLTDPGNIPDDTENVLEEHLTNIVHIGSETEPVHCATEGDIVNMDEVDIVDVPLTIVDVPLTMVDVDSQLPGTEESEADAQVTEGIILLRFYFEKIV